MGFNGVEVHVVLLLLFCPSMDQVRRMQWRGREGRGGTCCYLGASFCQLVHVLILSLTFAWILLHWSIECGFLYVLFSGTNSLFDIKSTTSRTLKQRPERTELVRDSLKCLSIELKRSGMRWMMRDVDRSPVELLSRRRTGSCCTYPLACKLDKIIGYIHSTLSLRGISLLKVDIFCYWDFLRIYWMMVDARWLVQSEAKWSIHKTIQS